MKSISVFIRQEVPDALNNLRVHRSDICNKCFVLAILNLRKPGVRI